MAVDQRKNAGRIWPLLVAAATARRTMTYGELAAPLRLFRRNLNQPLDGIAKQCTKIGWPPLTLVVVDTDTGVPATGVAEGDTLKDAYRRVYEFNWATVKNPFELFASTK